MAAKTIRRVLDFSEVTEMAKVLKKKLAQAGIPVKQLIIFGSYASGSPHKDSDIDIAVIIPSEISATDKRKISLIPWLAKQIHVKLEAHILSTDDMANKWFSFPAQIKEYGIKV